MRQAFTAIIFTALISPAMAQMNPVGLWRSMDDKSGEPKSEVRIAEQGGVLQGRIEKLLRKGADPAAKCVECKDALKDQPMVGLPIIDGAKKAEGKEVWEDGKILDPENGKEYRASYTPVDGGKKLEVRGYLGPFWRTQTWQRAQ